MPQALPTVSYIRPNTATMTQHLILVHGNSLSRRSWDALLSTPTLKAHTIHAIDLPGHGDAGHLPHGSGYTLELFAQHVTEVAATLPSCVLVGHSLGGHICARVPALAPGVKGMVVFGAPLLRSAADAARAYIPVPALAKAYTPQLDRTDAEELAEAFLWPGSPAIASMADDILRTDPRVRGNLGTALASGQMPDEVTMVKAAGVPVCIAHGADDPFIHTAYLDELATELNAGPVRHVAGAGHSPQVQRPAELAEVIAAFLDSLHNGTRP